MIVITYIYSHNARTKQTIDSFKRFGYEVAVIETDTHRGNGSAAKLLLECFKRAVTGHETFVYADAADSFCQRQFTIPGDRIIYSTEKACYPHTWVAGRYPPNKAFQNSPWKYLNGGGYGGSLKLIIDFFEKYGLDKLPSDANGQHEQMLAYIEAVKDGFPIELDLGCRLFQTMAFADPCEFEVIDANDTGDRLSLYNPVLKNKTTSNIPAILHFNGLTSMNILKELL